MDEHLVTLITAIASIITVPWSVWVTVSIFNQRQHIALLQAERDTLEEIRDLLLQFAAGGLR